MDFEDYFNLIEFFNGEIDRDSFKKFICIHAVEVVKPVDYKRKFTEFIKQCKKLKILILNNTSLDQAFYGELPSYRL